MTTPKISLGFPPGPLAIEAAELADERGSHRPRLYDPAPILADVWFPVARLAARPHRAGPVSQGTKGKHGKGGRAVRDRHPPPGA